MARKSPTKKNKGVKLPERGMAPGGPPPPPIPPEPPGPPPPFEDPTPPRVWLDRMPPWAGRFLESLVLVYGNVRGACLNSGISYTSAYIWRKKVPEFAEAWDGAVREGLDAAELQLFTPPRDLRHRDFHENLKWLLEKKRYHVGHRERVLAEARRDLVAEEAERAREARRRGEDASAIPRATIPREQAAAALFIHQSVMVAQGSSGMGQLPSPSTDSEESLATILGIEPRE